MGDARVLDFLTNLCGLPLMSAVPLVPGFVAAGVTTRAQLFALNDADLRGKCGLSHAAQRKKVWKRVMYCAPFTIRGGSVRQWHVIHTCIHAREAYQHPTAQCV
jgi:hypothetical protein